MECIPISSDAVTIIRLRSLHIKIHIAFPSKITVFSHHIQRRGNTQQNHIYIYFFHSFSFMYDIDSAMLIEATLSLGKLLTLAETDDKVLNSARPQLDQVAIT